MLGLFRREDHLDALGGASPGTEDYIMRQVTQFAKALAKILGLTNQNQHEEAHQEIGQAVKGLSGFSTGEICARSDTEIIQMLEIQASGVDLRDRLAFLSALLHAEASVCSAQGREDDATMRSLRALQFMLWTHERNDSKDIPSYAPGIVGLFEELADYVLPERTYAALIGYFERAGLYSKAEDILFDWIHSDEEPAAAAIEAGNAFYNRMLEKSDAELEAGGLPRGEVKFGMSELRDLEAGE